MTAARRNFNEVNAMKIIKAKSYQDLSRKAANLISAQVILKPECVLGLATGSTPIGTYRQLVEWYQKDDVDFSRVTTFNLDEYVGLSPENPQSYHAFMRRNLFDHVNLAPERCHVPDGCATDLARACREYDAAIAERGGIDLQLLGIGHNGHIGFNEPGGAFEKETHCVALTENTIQANARFFGPGEKVPTHAYTMGIKTIMSAKKILLIASGEDKAEILNKMICGPIVPAVPASVLQLHNDVTVVADAAALSQVPETLIG